VAERTDRHATPPPHRAYPRAADREKSRVHADGGIGEYLSMFALSVSDVLG
jgi:hypothetical protein